MARDKYHYIVREALEKEGWRVKSDPYITQHGGLRIGKSWHIEIGYCFGFSCALPTCFN